MKLIAPLTLCLLAPSVVFAQPVEPTPAAEPAPAAAPAPAEGPKVAVAEDPVVDPAAAPVAAPAPAEPAVDAGVEAKPPAWYDTISINGFASVAYSLNANRPSDQANQMRVFDTDHNTLNVDVIELVLQKAVAGKNDAGFRIDVTAGSSIPHLTASAGLFRDEDGNAQDVDLQQAFVSWIAPAGDGLRIDVGKFVTHTGYELIEGYDGFNDHYTRSILFGYAIPFTHTGVKASYPISSKLAAMVMLANGWDNVKDNNAGKTVGGMLTILPTDKVSAFLNYCGGPEQTGNSSNWRHLVDVVALFKAAPRLTLGVNGDFATEDGAAADGGAATWFGAALYGKYDVTARLALALRGEVFKDSDGVRTGAEQTVMEGTFSPTVKATDNLLLRGDLRFDRSDAEVFMTSDGTSDTQLTFAVNALGVF